MQCPTAFLVRPNVPRDRRDAEGEEVEARAPTDDLFRTPILAEHGIDDGPILRGDVRVASRAHATHARLRIREHGPVVAVVVGAVARDLADDRAAVAAQCAGDLRRRCARHARRHRDGPVVGGDLVRRQT